MLIIIIHSIYFRDFIWLFLHWSAQILLASMNTFIGFRILIAIVEWIIEWLIYMIQYLFIVWTFWAIIITMRHNLFDFITIIRVFINFFVNLFQYLFALFLSNGYSGLRILENSVQIVKFLRLSMKSFWCNNGNKAGRSNHEESNHCTHLADNDLDTLFPHFLSFFLLLNQFLLCLLWVKRGFVNEFLIYVQIINITH